MEVYGAILLVIGIIIYLIGSIQFIIAECRESVWWFIGGLIFPIVPFIFLCVHFHEAWPSMKVILLGFLLMIIGAFMCSEMDLSGSQRLFYQRIKQIERI
jgi:uncharacterized membrane protein